MGPMLICLISDVGLVLARATSSSPSSGMLVAPSKFLLKSKMLPLVQSRAQSGDTLAHSDGDSMSRVFFTETMLLFPCDDISSFFSSPRHHGPILAFWRNKGLLGVSLPARHQGAPLSSSPPPSPSSGLFPFISVFRNVCMALKGILPAWSPSERH